MIRDMSNQSQYLLLININNNYKERPITKQSHLWLMHFSDASFKNSTVFPERFHTVSLPLPSPMKNRPSRPTSITRTSCLENILPRTVNLKNTAVNVTQTKFLFDIQSTRTS